MGSLVVASLATAVVIGWLLLGTGIAEGVGAFWSRAGSGMLLHLVCGVLSVVVGVLFLRAPVDAALALGLLLACLLMSAGVLKIVAALTYRLGDLGWPVVSGLKPEDLVPAAVFLASDHAAMVTGACYDVSGGDDAMNQS